jgi:hypothetical protein
MIPFDVHMHGKKVGISWESLFWFFVVTAAATVVGELVYDKWIQPNLASLPNLPFGLGDQTPAPQAAQQPQGNVVQLFPGGGS